VDVRATCTGKRTSRQELTLVNGVGDKTNVQTRTRSYYTKLWIENYYIGRTSAVSTRGGISERAVYAANAFSSSTPTPRHQNAPRSQTHLDARLRVPVAERKHAGRRERERTSLQRTRWRRAGHARRACRRAPAHLTVHLRLCIDDVALASRRERGVARASSACVSVFTFMSGCAMREMGDGMTIEDAPRARRGGRAGRRQARWRGQGQKRAHATHN
jgi:hypothetical protein